MTQEKTYEIRESVLNEILGFLGKQPYERVFLLIEALKADVSSKPIETTEENVKN